MNTSDTIIAQATPLGFSGVAVIRMSGPKSFSIIKKLTKAKSFKSRQATLEKIVNKKMNVVDDALITFFPGPESYTGEDVVEISCHGNPVIVEEIVLLATSFGARIAEPGEYTKRAFLNGKVDLIQAEGIMALIEAKSIESVYAQQKIITGNLSNKVAEIKTSVVNILSLLENEMDISEDVSSKETIVEIDKSISNLTNTTKELIQSHKVGHYLCSGVSVVITGKPNVGKSTLLNQIVGSERAIVSKTPGTTRDIVDCEIKLCGVPVRLIDTAGIRETSGFVEKEGVKRAKKTVLGADLVLCVFDEESDVVIQKKDTPHLYILNKSDLRKKTDVKNPIIHISAKTGSGVGLLLDSITKQLGLHRISTDTIYVSSVRQKKLLTSFLVSVESAQKLINTDPFDMSLVAYELRCALDSIDAILGKTTAEDILNNIFSNFCVGK